MRHSMRLAPMAGLALMLAHGAVLPAHAAEFEKIVLSVEEGAEESVNSFASDTPKIHLGADIDEVASGSKVSVAWISVDSGGAAPPNYEIDRSTFDVGALDDRLNASLSRPDKGWPVGTYQVRLAVDGKVVETVDFSVE